jgi:hypothetical protein
MESAELIVKILREWGYLTIVDTPDTTVGVGMLVFMADPRQSAWGYELSAADIEYRDITRIYVKGTKIKWQHPRSCNPKAPSGEREEYAEIDLCDPNSIDKLFNTLCDLRKKAWGIDIGKRPNRHSSRWRIPGRC